MHASARTPLTALAVALLATGCGGGSAEAPAGTGGNTVGGCTAATVAKIVSGRLANTDGPDDPACQGLSEADVMKAGADAFADPRVAAYMADLIEKGGSGAPMTPEPMKP